MKQAAPLQSFPIDAVREQFPSLHATDDGKPRVYLDNPAGTQVPRSVADAAANALLHCNANLGGYFRTSRIAESVVQKAHEAMAAFVNASSYREVVIAQSMTNLTFHMAQSIARTLKSGDEIVLTRMDHDGNIGPWLMMAEDLGVTVRWVAFNRESWVIAPEDLRAVLSERTKLVALNYASNLTGSINDIAALTAIAKETGALVVVDAVQYAPHGLIDVQALNCDMLACSSYKFFGPHLGILWAREALLESLTAYKVRPQTAELPWKFETGTPQIELQAALTATVDYFDWLGKTCGAEGSARECITAAFAHSRTYETTLVSRLIDGLKHMPRVQIHGITDPSQFDRRVPTVSFNVDGHSPHDIARALAAENVFVWSGNNFALELVRALGLPEDEGVVRIGAAHYNTTAEIDAALAALEHAL